MSMASRTNDLTALIATAREGTRRSRQILAENVLDLAISPEGRLSDRERALTDQVLVRLARDMELEVRQKLALRLAVTPTAPVELVEMLAKDDISVARPILERSQLLSETTLIEIVRMRVREHQLCIARRENVSAGVSDALVEVAEPDVLEVLIRNPNATISSAAMAHLVAESRRLDQFQEPLLSRSDLPASLAHSMFWWVSSELRHKILTKFKIAEHELDEALEDATQTVLDDTAAASASNAVETAKTLTQALLQNDLLKIETLINMLRNQRIPAFCAGMSSLSGVSFATVNKIILDHEVAPFAVLCKAIKVKEAHFSTMALLLLQSRDKHKQTANTLRNLLDLFNEISSDQARITLRYWHSESALQMNVQKRG